VANLVIRNIDPELKRLVAKLAADSGQSLSDEAAALIRSAVCSDKRLGLGDRLFNMVDPRHRGDDLVFEYKGSIGPPPDFD